MSTKAPTLYELRPEWKHREEYGKMHTFVEFDCPICRTHRIEIPIKGEDRRPDAEWDMEGTDFHDLTLKPSIAHTTHYADGMLLPPRLCKSHFFVRNGKIITA